MNFFEIGFGKEFAGITFGVVAPCPMIPDTVYEQMLLSTAQFGSWFVGLGILVNSDNVDPDAFLAHYTRGRNGMNCPTATSGYFHSVDWPYPQELPVERCVQLTTDLTVVASGGPDFVPVECGCPYFIRIVSFEGHVADSQMFTVKRKSMLDYVFVSTPYIGDDDGVSWEIMLPFDVEKEYHHGERSGSHPTDSALDANEVLADTMIVVGDIQFPTVDDRLEHRKTKSVAECVSYYVDWGTTEESRGHWYAQASLPNSYLVRWMEDELGCVGSVRSVLKDILVYCPRSKPSPSQRCRAGKGIMERIMSLYRSDFDVIQYYLDFKGPLHRRVLEFIDDNWDSFFIVLLNRVSRPWTSCGSRYPLEKGDYLRAVKKYPDVLNCLISGVEEIRQYVRHCISFYAGTSDKIWDIVSYGYPHGCRFCHHQASLRCNSSIPLPLYYEMMPNSVDRATGQIDTFSCACSSDFSFSVVTTALLPWRKLTLIDDRVPVEYMSSRGMHAMFDYPVSTGINTTDSIPDITGVVGHYVVWGEAGETKKITLNTRFGFPHSNADLPGKRNASRILQMIMALWKLVGRDVTLYFLRTIDFEILELDNLPRMPNVVSKLFVPYCMHYVPAPVTGYEPIPRGLLMRYGSGELYANKLISSRRIQPRSFEEDYEAGGYYRVSDLGDS